MTDWATVTDVDALRAEIKRLHTNETQIDNELQVEGHYLTVEKAIIVRAALNRALLELRRLREAR